MPHEFELIAQILRGLGDSDELVLGAGDDCALVALAPDHLLASSIDGFSEGRHFPRAADPWLVAQRCLRASLSDLAAMGAAPVFALVSLKMPGSDANWLEAFVEGVRDAASEFGCPIAGGNLSEGELSVTISVHGSVPRQGALTRSGAQAGQDVFVSGVLGGAATALTSLTKALDRETLASLTRRERHHPLNRYWLPEPRLELGQALIGKASAAIDISDGLYADTWHLVDASQTGVRMNAASVPLIGDAAQSDDYELLFIAPHSVRCAVEALGKSLDLKVTRIGETTPEVGVWLDEQMIPAGVSGYRHFG